MERDQKAIPFNGTIILVREPTNDPNTESPQEGVRGVKAGSRVVVATDDDDIEPRQSTLSLGKKAVPEYLGLRRRVGIVEDVTADEERVDGFSFKCIKEPRKERLVLGLTRMIMQGVAKMPVGCMQYLHAHFLIESTLSRSDI
jgi:hypothetical protein